MFVVVNATSGPLYPRERDPVPILQEAGCTSELVWTANKSLPQPGFESWTVDPVANRYTDYAVPNNMYVVCVHN